ncbi:hypothetical protein [Delftia sp. ZNC0008]|uniref:hypothetical protein n=1 Tax=Delftia sp. ZNC0008 TaxID=1339242 RepID=UPI0012E07469|nr:hypothetical protein [Delftia sp. ZNC0008]
MSSGKYAIRSDLVYELLTYGDGLGQKMLSIKGNWSNGHQSNVAKGILTWLAQKAFNSNPMPWQPDTCFCYSLQKEVFENVTSKLVYLIENEQHIIHAAVDELRTMRCAHEQWLKNYHKEKVINVGGVDFISLGRAYLDEYSDKIRKGFASTLYELKVFSEALHATGESNIPDIMVPHNLLTSWSRHAGYPQRSVKVQTLIPINDILCSADFLQTRSTNKEIMAIEGGEWIVLTMNPTGFRKIPAQDISLACNSLRPESMKVPDLMTCRSQLKKGFPLSKRDSGLTFSSEFFFENRVRQLPWGERVRLAWKMLLGHPF